MAVRFPFQRPQPADPPQNGPTRGDFPRGDQPASSPLQGRVLDPLHGRVADPAASWVGAAPASLPGPSSGPVEQPVSRWPGWDQPTWQPAWPMGTIPAHPGPANDYAEQQSMFAGGGPMFAGPDANPGGPDANGDGMPPAGFRIFGTM